MGPFHLVAFNWFKKFVRKGNDKGTRELRKGPTHLVKKGRRHGLVAEVFVRDRETLVDIHGCCSSTDNTILDGREVTCIRIVTGL